MLGRAPEHARALRRDGQSNTEVVQVELIVRFTNNVFVGIVSCEGADGCAYVEGGSSKLGNAPAELIDVSA
jgi:hypothetical protein